MAYRSHGQGYSLAATLLPDTNYLCDLVLITAYDRILDRNNSKEYISEYISPSCWGQNRLWQ